MNLLEAIRNVDRSPPNTVLVNQQEFASALRLSESLGRSYRLASALKGYWLHPVRDQGEVVGQCAYYLYDMPVAYSYHSSRTERKRYYFVSEEAAVKVREFILSLYDVDQRDYDLIPEYTTISDVRRHSSTSQVVNNVGLYKGCEVRFSVPAYDDLVEVIIHPTKVPDANPITVPLREIEIPINLARPAPAEAA